jgi:hypothetical protein
MDGSILVAVYALMGAANVPLAVVDALAGAAGAIKAEGLGRPDPDQSNAPQNSRCRCDRLGIPHFHTPYGRFPRTE